jgi:hypothetical protein
MLFAECIAVQFAHCIKSRQSHVSHLERAIDVGANAAHSSLSPPTPHLSDGRQAGTSAVMSLREVDETLIEESDEDASAERSNEAFSGNRVDSGQRDNGNFQGEVHRHDSNDSSLSESTRTLRSVQPPSIGQVSGGFDSTQFLQSRASGGNTDELETLVRHQCCGGVMQKLTLALACSTTLVFLLQFMNRQHHVKSMTAVSKLTVPATPTTHLVGRKFHLQGMQKCELNHRKSAGVSHARGQLVDRTVMMMMMRENENKGQNRQTEASITISTHCLA